MNEDKGVALSPPAAPGGRLRPPCSAPPGSAASSRAARRLLLARAAERRPAPVALPAAVADDRRCALHRGARRRLRAHRLPDRRLPRLVPRTPLRPVDRAVRRVAPRSPEGIRARPRAQRGSGAGRVPAPSPRRAVVVAGGRGPVRGRGALLHGDRAPIVLLPMFYRFQPLERESLRARLMSLSEKAGVPVLGVLRVGPRRQDQAGERRARRHGANPPDSPVRYPAERVLR